MQKVLCRRLCKYYISLLLLLGCVSVLLNYHQESVSTLVHRAYVFCSGYTATSNMQAGMSPDRSRSLVVHDDNQPINPGCLFKKFDMYMPIDVGVIYHHPSIVHYAKLSTDASPVSLTFLEHMSVLSAYKFLRPKRIIIHTYGDIVGRYWNRIKKWNRTSIEVNKVERVTHFGDKKVEFVQNQADYIKLRALLELGGVISDFDVIVINGQRYQTQQRIAECVLSKGGKNGQFVNPGFISCVKNSSFVRRWLDGYHKDYKPELYVYNASLKPLHILEDEHSKVCYNVYVDDTICLNPNATKEKLRWMKRNGVYWRSKTAAHHFLKNGDARLLKKKHSFGEMLQYVMNT